MYGSLWGRVQVRSNEINLSHARRADIEVSMKSELGVAIDRCREVLTLLDQPGCLIVSPLRIFVRADVGISLIVLVCKEHRVARCTV